MFEGGPAHCSWQKRVGERREWERPGSLPAARARVQRACRTKSGSHTGSSRGCTLARAPYGDAGWALATSTLALYLLGGSWRPCSSQAIEVLAKAERYCSRAAGSSRCHAHSRSPQSNRPPNSSRGVAAVEESRCLSRQATKHAEAHDWRPNESAHRGPPPTQRDPATAGDVGGNGRAVRGCLVLRKRLPVGSRLVRTRAQGCVRSKRARRRPQACVSFVRSD